MTRPASKWIDFTELPRSKSGKTRRFEVVVKTPKPVGDEPGDSEECGGLLGEVRWYGAWRRYAFWPTQEMSTVFESQCLRDIAAFCDWLTAERRAERG